MTRSMIASGETVSFPNLTLPAVDKHSTGGVADGVTLVFAPLAAALGLAVAKLSGRGLGSHRGNPGQARGDPRPSYRPDARGDGAPGGRSWVRSRRPVRRRLVPADGSLYALRDSTATVPSVPLIAASVMSKKLAVRPT